MDFINAHTPSDTEVFSLLDVLGSIGGGRYEGRIPPGHQDRNKSSKQVEEVIDGEKFTVKTGSNKWGDLFLWKEVLTLARAAKAKSVILLTNDVKNDWQFGGRVGPAETDLTSQKKEWKAVPLPHPMLCLEAVSKLT
jgi:hypothetical protein